MSTSTILPSDPDARSYEDLDKLEYPIQSFESESSSPSSLKKSMTALSSTLSASSSVSGSNMSGDNDLQNARFKHYHQPTVSDSSFLVSLCQRYINENNVEALAKLARNRGLPPFLRQYAWPLLLATHPYVQNPSVYDEYPGSRASAQDTDIPYKRISKELERCRKSFAKSGNHVKKDAKNANINLNTIDETEEASRLIAEAVEARMQDEQFGIIEEAVIAFLEKWEKTVSYDPGLIWCAVALAEWVHPMFEMSRSDGTFGGRTRNFSGSSTGSSETQSESPSPYMSPLQSWNPSAFSFSVLFEQLMLVILHYPARNCDGPSGPLDSPIDQRGMLFLSVLRNLLPDLSAHFDEENILCTIGGDEWLVWWLKWLGAKCWNKHDLARVWDMYLGWRPHESIVDGEDEARTLNDSADEREQGLGLDPFWNPNNLDNTAEILDPHTQHVFVCISFLKSLKAPVMELDQSEIRQYLLRMARSKDMEFIISEAGEDWRSWQWKEENEDNT